MDFVHDLTPEEYNRFPSQSYWIGVIGSRDITDQNLINVNLDYLIKKLLEVGEIKNLTDVIIISGKARGVDRMALKYARANHLTDVNILGDWNKYGKSAGMKRNPNIIRHSNRILAFRLNKSKGTTNGIDHARKLGIPYHVIDI